MSPPSLFKILWLGFRAAGTLHGHGSFECFVECIRCRVIGVYASGNSKQTGRSEWGSEVGNRLRAQAQACGWENID
eukprot:1912651-Amphidinium_carterae.2